MTPDFEHEVRRLTSELDRELRLIRWITAVVAIVGASALGVAYLMR